LEDYDPDAAVGLAYAVPDPDLPLPVRAHLLEGAQDIYHAAFNNAFERSYNGDPRQEEIAHNRVWQGRRSSAAM
jgi:cation transport regulator ChaB